MKWEPKFSVIIPFVDKDADLVTRAELSVKEQDYTNFEIIAVHDKDRRGASWARNEGARKATGDVFLFLDADCILEPGVFTMCLMAWEDDPEADWIYGQYRFLGQDLAVYQSRPWNPYVLRSMNYISTMSPMKREAFNNVWVTKTGEIDGVSQMRSGLGFRENLPYFQDWDFFLRAARNGKRGHFLPQLLFSTELPGKDSISGDPTVPFWEKIAHVKRLNGIEQSPICVTTLGAPLQGESRAEFLGADYLGSNMETALAWMPGMWGEHPYKLVYVMGFYPKGLDAHQMAFQNAPEDCKFLVHWIGTDVYQLHTQFTWHTIKAIKEDVLPHVTFQRTTAQWLTDELAEVGIAAPLLYAPIDPAAYPILPEAKSFAVGCYVSDTNPMHNEQFLQDVARSLPHIKFFFFGKDRKDSWRNIEYVGRLKNIRSVLMESSVCLRMTRHDGLPQTVIQYLMSGRDAICNVPVEHADFIDARPNEDDWGLTKNKVMHAIMKSKERIRTRNERTRIRMTWTERTDPGTYVRAVRRMLEDTSDVVGASDPRPGRLFSLDGGQCAGSIEPGL